MAFGSIVRFNPEHAPNQTPLGTGKPPQLAIKPASIPQGLGPTQHLGRAASPNALSIGHIKIK